MPGGVKKKSWMRGNELRGGSGVVPHTQEDVMDEYRVAGTARKIGGSAQEAVGRVIGDAQTQAAGVANQVAGAAQDLYGQAREGAAQVANAVSEGAASARANASSFEVTVRNAIESQPYTAVVIALGLGWLLGRMHRPL
jgi:uncharacterized protein YjbJ (UPF0337 family)